MSWHLYLLLSPSGRDDSVATKIRKEGHVCNNVTVFDVSFTKQSLLSFELCRSILSAYFIDKPMYLCLFCYATCRTGVPAIQERNEESFATKWDYQYRHRQGSLRQKLPETTHYGIPGQSSRESLHTRQQQGHVLRTRGCEVRSSGWPQALKSILSPKSDQVEFELIPGVTRGQ